MIRGVTPLFKRSFQFAQQQPKFLNPAARTIITSSVRIWTPAVFTQSLNRSVQQQQQSHLIKKRGLLTRSLPRRGHNLEDHYDMAEFVCKIHSPLSEYVMWTVILFVLSMVTMPILHSNYYFTGRFLPKDQGNTQLTDDSW